MPAPEDIGAIATGAVAQTGTPASYCVPGAPAVPLASAPVAGETPGTGS
jgi:hypothetical protein